MDYTSLFACVFVLFIITFILLDIDILDKCSNLPQYLYHNKLCATPTF